MKRIVEGALRTILLVCLLFALAYADPVEDLFSSVNKSDLREVREVIENGANVNAKNEFGTPALMIACIKGNFDVVGYLVEKGADVNAKDKNGGTALIAASQYAPFNVIKFLIENNADVNAQTNKEGIRALNLAMARNPFDFDVVKYLVEKGADVNAKDNRGITVLMDTCYSGRFDVVKYLVEKGAKVNAKDDKGWTPLMWASSFGHLDVVKYLVEKGADINIKNQNSETAHMLAFMNGHHDIGNYLTGKSTNLKGEGLEKQKENLPIIIELMEYGNAQIKTENYIGSGIVVKISAREICEGKIDKTTTFMIDRDNQKVGVDYLHIISQKDTEGAIIPFSGYHGLDIKIEEKVYKAYAPNLLAVQILTPPSGVEISFQKDSYAILALLFKLEKSSVKNLSILGKNIPLEFSK